MNRHCSHTWCEHYCQGACMLAENRNPGLEARFCCACLSALMEEWDAFLDRAEAFGLAEDMAARIWNGRKHAALESGLLCPPVLSGALKAHPLGEDCPYIVRGACLLAMPRCTAVCKDFRKRSR